jgi:hypothetical protein
MFARMELFWLSAPAFFAICQAWFESKERKEMEELREEMQRDREKWDEEMRGDREQREQEKEATKRSTEKWQEVMRSIIDKIPGRE